MNSKGDYGSGMKRLNGRNRPLSAIWQALHLQKHENTHTGALGARAPNYLRRMNRFTFDSKRSCSVSPRYWEGLRLERATPQRTFTAALHKPIFPSSVALTESLLIIVNPPDRPSPRSQIASTPSTYQHPTILQVNCAPKHEAAYVLLLSLPLAHADHGTAFQ